MGNHNTVDSQDNPGVARTAWNATGGKIRSLSPTLRQVVTGLTVCQVIMVAVSSVTLGALVNRNVRLA